MKPHRTKLGAYHLKNKKQDALGMNLDELKPEIKDSTGGSGQDKDRNYRKDRFGVKIARGK